MTTDGTSLRLSHRVVKGGVWVFALSITQQLFSLVRLVILARILSPHDFGVMGITLLAMATLETFTQTGFNQALIQKKENIKPYLDSAWTAMIIRGLILFMLMLLVARSAANFFSVPEAKFIIQVMGISILFHAFTNIGLIYFQKELEFNKEFVYQLSGTLADFIVAVSVAIIFRNIWALVLGKLAGNFIRLIVSFLVHPYRPRWSFDAIKIKELFGFGKWILGSSILTFLIKQGDNIFVGKLLGATALGYYQMAYRISNMPSTAYSALIAKVSFPAYAKLQTDIRRLRKAYLKVLQLSAFVSIPIAGGIFILAPEFTEIFLGEKWLPMVPAMQVLAIYGMLSSVLYPGPVFMAVGRPDLRTKLQFLNLIIMAILIYPFTRWWGIAGTALAVTSYLASTSIVAMAVVLKIIESGYKKPIKILLLPFLNTLIMILTIYSLKTLVGPDINLGWLLVLICVGILAYLFIAYIFDHIFSYGGKKLLYDQLAALRR